MPLLLLAGALKAVEAIQQGCELYKEYKGTVLQAKATFDEVKGIAVEVSDVGIGIWDFIKSKLFPSEEPIKPPTPETPINTANPAVNKPTNQRIAPQEYDEQIIKAELIKNLKVFFKAMIAIQKKIAQQQDRIDHEVIEPDELLDVSLDLVVAKKEMEKAQKEYYLTEQMRAIQKELGEKDDLKSEIQEFEERLKKKTMPEEAEQKVLKRIEVGFDLVAEFGFRQEKPGEEGAVARGLD